EGDEELKAGIIHDKLRVKGSPLSKALEQELDRITTELNGQPANLLGVRARLRQVRRAVNEYRDERWDGLVRARLRLVRSAVMTAWTAYGLLIWRSRCALHETASLPAAPSLSSAHWLGWWLRSEPMLAATRRSRTT